MKRKPANPELAAALSVAGMDYAIAGGVLGSTRWMIRDMVLFDKASPVREEEVAYILGRPVGDLFPHRRKRRPTTTNSKEAADE